MIQNRTTIATRLHANAQIPRAEVFGENDEKYRPIQYLSDASTMFAGYVGPTYEEGGVVIFGVNPGGGSDSAPRPPDDERLYPRLRAFRDANDTKLLAEFEAINNLFPSIVREWNLWRILQPTLNALGKRLEDAVYLNAVPYRTRENKKPPISAQVVSWERIVSPTLTVLEPGVLVSLGRAVGGIVERFLASETTHYVIPRTNGDRYISLDAASELERIRAERGT